MAVQASRGPRVRVAALMLLDGDVVVVRHRAGRDVYHLLPGGGVDLNETLSDALKREVAEETGLLIDVGRPLIINDTIDPSGARHVVNITFAATIIGGSITSSPSDLRVEGVELVSPDALTKLDMRPPIASEIEIAVANEEYPTKYVGSVFVEVDGSNIT